MTTVKYQMWRIFLPLVVVWIASSTSVAEWQLHEVRQLNGKDQQIRLPAQFQIVTESWHRVVAVPYIIYMPEIDQLLMLVGCDYPHRAYILTSDDRGASWTDPRPALVDKDGKPSAIVGAGLTGDLGTGLAYLGDGNALFYVCFAARQRWSSRDYGKTWGAPVPIAPTSDGKPWWIWDPPLVDRDPKTGGVIRLAETGHARAGTKWQAYIRFSSDEGQTWNKSIKVPQWHGVSEVALLRAGNGDLVAACRTDIPDRIKDTLDHYCGLAVSLSTDDGQTWSELKVLYEYGRHHPSLVLMPDGDIVMTYVVRLGYVNTKDGFRQFGVEAIVSHDHGRTWDLDHKYILHAWASNQKGKHAWWPSSQATSSQLLPDGSIITAFGTGYRIRSDVQAPRDIGLVQWRRNTGHVNTDTTIRDAAFDSDLRNIFDPSF